MAAPTYLPLRVNMAGVIPVIFAASLMAFPPTVGELLQAYWAQDFSSLLLPGRPAYLSGIVPHHRLHLLLHRGHLQPGGAGGQPEEVRRVHPRGEARPADGRISGPHLRAADLPGRALPRAGRGAADDPDQPDLSANFFFGGTSILIVVGVALDTMKQLEAQLMMRNYEGFLSGGR